MPLTSALPIASSRSRQRWIMDGSSWILHSARPGRFNPTPLNDASASASRVCASLPGLPARGTYVHPRPRLCRIYCCRGFKVWVAAAVAWSAQTQHQCVQLTVEPAEPPQPGPPRPRATSLAPLQTLISAVHTRLVHFPISLPPPHCLHIICFSSHHGHSFEPSILSHQHRCLLSCPFIFYPSAPPPSPALGCSRLLRALLRVRCYPSCLESILR